MKQRGLLSKNTNIDLDCNNNVVISSDDKKK